MMFDSCDLLENSYLCGISNNGFSKILNSFIGCDLLENSYLCGISNNEEINDFQVSGL